jgi:AraC-like DNA-binding protein
MTSPPGQGGAVAAAADHPPGDPIRLAYLAPPAELAPYITTFFLFRCDWPVIRDIQPAATAQLQVYLRGKGQMFYPGGRTARSHPITLQSPQTAAAPFEMEGPFHSFGAVLAPLGWVALTRLDAARHADRLIDAVEVFGPGIAAIAAQIRDLYDADPEMDGADLVPLLAEYLQRRLRPIPPAHAAIVQHTVDWLGTGFHPPLADLHARCGCSPRQVQRLVARYFGSNPTHLARKYRATRVTALLNEPGVSDETVAMLTDQFYDQSHMIREIREFIGRTPARYGDGHNPILEAMVDVRNFYQIKPHVAPMPPLEKEAAGD